MSKAQEYFDLHPHVDTFYSTKDGQFFEKKGHAVSHARDLGDAKEVETHERTVKENEGDLEKPTAESTVAEIKAYLDSQAIDYTGKTKKEDLLALLVAE